ncbi:MAG: AMP-binding protein [Acidimicrobiales bacterium]
MNRLIAIALPGGPRYFDELHRAFDDGDAVLPVDTRLGRPARERLLESMRPHSIVEEPGQAQVLGYSEPVEPGDALVMATSGTTGRQQGVVLTHDAVAASAHATSRRLGVDPSADRWWACLPLAHIGGLSVLLRSMVEGVGCEVVEGFSPEGAAAALNGGATLTSLVPTALRRLSPEVSSGFRQILLGGQAPPAGLAPNVVTTYGMTETGSGVVYDGLPLDGVEVRVDPVDSQIFLRAPMLLRSYRDGHDPKTADGWLPTGDAGTIDSKGRLVVKGRLGDLIISGGENVWPGSLEPLIKRHPSVLEVAVGGRPDPEWGERVTAYLVVTEPVDAVSLLAELRSIVSEQEAAFAAPREIVIVPKLPKTGLGKLRRGALGALEGQSASV